MEDETKICPNCKRDIPAANFTVHSLHCARNISICPVCKEPVSQHELQDHHEKMHKLLRCKQCGESVCGSDLEDHVRDSCALTVKSCRYCSLELPRRELPPHEAYCGARTDQCPACHQWVMIKYRQLHLDSNHGFLRLDDDPDPTPSASANGRQQATPLKNINTDRSQRAEPARAAAAESTASIVRAIVADNLNGAIPKVPKRTNDQPQINTAVVTPNKVIKNLGGRGTGAKRRAPPPPAPPPLASRDAAYYSAERRRQQEEHERRERNQYNQAHGLPPVLSAAEKLEKLRKMDALHNREQPPADCSGRLRGQVWGRGQVSLGQPLGHSSQIKKEEFKDLKPMSNEQFMERFRELQMGGEAGDAAPGVGGGADRREVVDRFGEIKSSLSQLRRGLNQIRYTYDNAAPQGATSPGPVGAEPGPPSPPGLPVDEDEVPLPCEFCGLLVLAGELVQHQTGCRPDLAQLRPRRRDDPGTGTASAAPLIPCEFCSESLPLYAFSDHLARCRHSRPPSSPSPPSPSPPARSRPPSPHEDEPPVIPCEFCTESLPVYLFSEHVKRCSGGGLLLYPD